MPQRIDSSDRFLAQIAAFAVRDSLLNSPNFGCEVVFGDVGSVVREPGLQPEGFVGRGIAKACTGGREFFDPLLERRGEIESACSLELDWDDMPGARASQIAAYLEGVDPDDRKRWPEYRQWGIETLGELRQSFGAAIAELP